MDCCVITRYSPPYPQAIDYQSITRYLKQFIFKWWLSGKNFTKMAKKNFFPDGEIRLYPFLEADRTLDRKWEVKWKHNGRKKKLPVPHKPTLSARNKAAQELIARIKANPADPTIRRKNPPASVHTGHLFKLLEDRSNRLERKSVQTYHSQVKNLDAFCKLRGYKSVTEPVAKAFIDYLLSEGYHPVTVQNHIVTLITLFNRLKKEKIIRHNPFEHVEKVRGESDVRSHFTDAELMSVKKELLLRGKTSVYNACQYLYFLLCRPKELRLMKIRDIDFENWTIKISWRTGKTKKTRYVTIPTGLQEFMKNQNIESYPLDYYLCGLSGLPSEKPVSANYWSAGFTAVLRDLGFDESYVLYSIKNTGARKWYKAGIDMFSIQKQIGHQDPKTTQIYFRSMGVLDFAHVNAHVPAF